MKKIIFIAFIVFIPFILNAQENEPKTKSRIIKYDDNAFYYIYTPLNIGAVASTDQIIFSGASSRTKSDKTDGSSKAYQRWMRYWIDSTNAVQDAGFADSTTWLKSSQVIFNSGVLSFTDVSLANIQDTLLIARTTGMPCRIQFTVSNTTGLRMSFQERNMSVPVSPVVISGATTYANGTYQIDYTTAGRDGFYIEFSTAGSTGDIDNISIISMIDSVSGYQKILSGIAEDIPYYYSQSGRYITKTDTIYAYAETDTVYSIVNPPTAYDIYASIAGINVQWVDNSSVETGYEVYRDTIDGSNWVLQTTTAPNIESYLDTEDSLIAEGSYKYRIRAVGTYSNSAYSGIMNAKEVGAITDTTPPDAPTNIDAINLALITPPAPPDTIPLMTDFANVVGGDTSAYYQGFTVLNNLDSCWVSVSALDSMKKGALGTYNTMGFRGYEGDTIYTALTTSSSYSTTTSNTITAGGQQKTFSVTTFADPAWDGNIWYVNDDVDGGSANGTTWANAWNSLDDINWSNVQAGDTIYVSGGIDSTVYRTRYTGFADGLNTVVKDAPYVTYASGDPVVIANAWEAGHNGDVYFMTMGSTQAYLFHTKGISNIEFNGLKFYDLRTSWTGYSGLLYIGGGDTGDIDSMQIFKNCEIVGQGQGTLIYTAGSKVEYRNNLVRQSYNELEWDQDPFGFSSGRGGYIIDGNRIEYLVNDLVGGESAHRDVLQFSNYGMNSRHEVVTIQISNNIILQPYENVNWTGIIYSSTPQTATDWYIYNNIIYSNNTSDGVTPIYLNQPDITNANRMSVHLLNNTFIINSESDGSSTPIAIAGGDDTYQDFGVDTIICKNNLVVTRAPVNLFLNLRIMYPPGVYYRDFDYNVYMEDGGISGNFTNGEGFGSYTLASWLADGYDANSITGNATSVSFADEGGYDIADYYSVTGRHYGVDLSATYPFLQYDILGNLRQNDWDIGALQYQDGGITETSWKRIEPFLRNSETDFWKGLQR